MDGVSVAASIVGIATAGVAISIKLVTLATQISTASERVSSIGNDISLTSGVLHQLGELMTQKTTGDGISIFSQGGLETTRTSAAMCERIFHEVNKELVKASEQLRGCKRLSGGKIKLSKTEKAKWPFLQPSIDVLRADLREAKGTLMLMLQVTSLALSKRMADQHLVTQSSNSIEQRDLMRAIVALHAQQHLGEGKLTGASSKGLKGGGPSTPTTTTGRRGSYRSSSGDETSITYVQSQASRSQERVDARKKIARSSTEKYDQPAQFPNVLRGSTVDALDKPDCDFPQNSPLIVFHASSLPISGCGNSDPASPARSLNVEKTSQEVESSREMPIPTQETSKELNLFLVKPIVKDFFDKIELSWTVQDTKMQGPVIRKHMDKNDEDGIPSVIDMLEQLHEYENVMVNAELTATSSRPAASLVSLKRTKTDMRHRDFMLKGVPGLQFVVERQMAPVTRFSVDAPTLTPMYSATDGTINPAALNQPVKKRSGRSAPPDYAKLTREMRTKGPPQMKELRQRISENSRPSLPGKNAPNDMSVKTLVRKHVKGLALSSPNRTVRTDQETGGIVPENEREAKPGGPFSGLEGCVVVKGDLIEDGLGNTVGRIVEGDSKRLVGKPVDEDGDVLDRRGNVKGHAVIISDHESAVSESPESNEVVPEQPRKPNPEAPFAGFEGCVVVKYENVKNEMVEDEDGNAVGCVVENNYTRAGGLVGLAVDEVGDILDRHGNIVGRAEPYEEPECEVADLSSLDGKVVAATGNIVDEIGTVFGRVAEGDPAMLVGRKVDSEGCIWNEKKQIIGQAELLPGGTPSTALKEELQSGEDSVVPPDERHGITTDGLTPQACMEIDEQSSGRPDWAEDDEASAEEKWELRTISNTMENFMAQSPARAPGTPSFETHHEYDKQIFENQIPGIDGSDVADQSVAQSLASSPEIPLPQMDYERWQPEAEELENQILGIDGSHVADQSVAQSPASAPQTYSPREHYEVEQHDEVGFENRISGLITPPSTVADEKRKRNTTASHRFRERRKEKEREASEKISKLEQQVQSLLKIDSQDQPDAYWEMHSDAESIESQVGEDNVIGTDDEDPMVADLLVDLLEKYTTLYR